LKGFLYSRKVNPKKKTVTKMCRGENEGKKKDEWTGSTAAGERSLPS